MQSEILKNTDDSAETLSISTHLLAGWPLLLLMVFGGVVGLISGSLAYLINLKIYRSPLNKMQKILANVLCGMSAISLWWFVAQWLQAHLGA